jgi:hypothetical protein
MLVTEIKPIAIEYCDGLSEAIKHSPEFSDIAAFGLGGSWAINQADKYSDIDIFLYCNLQSIPALNASLKKLVSRDGSTLLCVQNDFFPGFGFRTAFYQTSIGIVEIFLVALEMIYPTTMVKKTRLLWDRRGVSEQLAIASDEPLAISETLNRIAYDWLAASIKLRKAHQRKNVVACQNRIQKLKSLALLAWYQTHTGNWIHPLEADGSAISQLEKNIPHAISNAMVAASQLTAIPDIYNALFAHTSLFFERNENYCRFDVSSWRLETTNVLSNN